MSQTYRVNDIYHCIQGEGCQTGLPMVLIRLMGCPVACPWCDTKETWRPDEELRVDLHEAMGQNPWWAEATAADIVRHIRANVLPRRQHPLGWALLTGGEPAQQPLSELVKELHHQGLCVALETSGTALGHVGAGVDWVCVSPKVGMPGGEIVLPEAVAEADEIKWVVAGPRDIERLKGFLGAYQLKEDTQVCLQPVSQNAAATRLCVEVCKEMGWRLSIQTHKYLNLP